MAFSIPRFQFAKPIEIDGDKIKANIGWLLVRVPSIAMTVPSAYGVAMFAQEKLPHNVATLAGYAFEFGFIGAIAIADQQYAIRKKDSKLQWYQQINTSGLLWWLFVLTAVIASVLSNLLFFSGGSYEAITPEIATHAIPLPVVNLMYNLVLHNSVTSKQHTVVCVGCGRIFEGSNCQDQLNGHKPHCKGK